MRLVPAFALTLILAAPLQAQIQAQTPPAEDPPGTSLQGMLDDMMGVVNPWLADLVEMMGDLTGWHAPEFLPNGDILIRRRLPDEPQDAPEDQDLDEPLAPGESLEL